MVTKTNNPTIPLFLGGVKRESMKVMCIKNGEWLDDSYGSNFDLYPSFGEIVTASQCPVYSDCFDLKEYPTDGRRPTSWLKIHFIPLSTIDETELIKEREEVFA